MKRLLFLMILSLALVYVFAGCDVREVNEPADQSDVTDQTIPENNDEEQKVLVEEFTQLLEDGIDENVALGKMRATMPGLNKDNATEMILAFEEYQLLAQDEVLTQGTINLLAQYLNYTENELNDPEQIAETELKSAIKEIQAKGYKLRFAEGMHWAIIDYSVYLEFAEYANEDIAAYIQFVMKESEQSTIDDATLVVPIEEIYSRARLAEDFGNDYPNSIKYDFMHERYQRYVNFYFYGVDNTPVFDFVTQTLNDDFLASYEQVKDDEQISVLADKTADYLVILEANSYTLTDDVTKFRNSIFETLFDI